MQPLKIFLHDYAGHPFQVDLSRELARRGHIVTHAYFAGDTGPKGSLSRKDDDPEGLSFLGVDIEGGYSKTSFVKRRFQDLAYGRAAAAAISDAAPDIVISGNTPTEAQTRVLRATKASGGRFLYWCQDFYSIAVTKILSNKLPALGHAVGAYYQALERRQFLQSDAVVLITEDFAPQARSWGVSDDRLHVVPNWGAIDDIPLRDKSNAWAAEHGLEDKFVYLYSGTLGLKHNPELLAELARKLSHDDRVRVVVVSAGSGFDKLAELKAGGGLDNLILLPLQPFERFADVLGSADALLAVIEREAGVFSVPSKILSYLCAGRSVLLAAPDENLAARTIRSADCGLTVEPEDIDGWLAGAAKLLEAESKRRSMGANGRAYAEANFNIQTVADRFEAVFRATDRSLLKAA